MNPLDMIGVSLKAKYSMRTGSPGNYKYWYRNPKTGALQAGKKPASTTTKEWGLEGFKRISDKDKRKATKEMSVQELPKSLSGLVKPGQRIIDKRGIVYLIKKKPSKGKTTYSGKYPGGYKGIGLNEANKRMERVKGTKFSKGMSAVINGQLQSVKELGFEEFKKRVNSAINNDYPVVLDINGEKTGI